MALTLACGSGSTEPDSNNNNPPGSTRTNVSGRTDRTITVDGQQREFVVYVGSTVGATTAVPVVFMYHGTSGDGPEFFDQSGWRQQADQEGLIAVFPSGLTYCLFEDENRDGDFSDPGERHVTTKWAAGELGSAAMPLCTAQDLATLNAQNRALADHPLRNDVAFVDAMIAFLKQNYVIDEKAIYSTGFSNGAQFSNRLAVERNNVFAATAAHAGGLVVPPNPGRNLSAIFSGGASDPNVCAILGVSAIPISANTLNDFPLLMGQIQPLLQQLRLTTAYTYSQPVINGKQVGRWTFSTSTAGASNSLTFNLLEDNLHAYPNGTGHPIVMANLLWQFFKTQRLP